jgi:hypothetical protein
MGERTFAEPIKANDIHDSVQTLKPDKWEKHDLTLMLVGATLGCMVTVLFMGGILLMIGGK